MIKIQSAILKKSKPNVPIKTKKSVGTDEAASTAFTASTTSTTSATPTASATPTTPISQVSYPKAKKSFPAAASSSPVKLDVGPPNLEIIQIDDSPPMAKASFSCSLCPFTTASISCLKKHETSHHLTSHTKKGKHSPKSDPLASEVTQSELAVSTPPTVTSAEGNVTGIAV